jgi:YjbE family integral membrane protein
MLSHLQNEIMQPTFWLALSKVVWIDILLSGDNALVIAMACRGLAPRQRFWGMVLGAGGAVALRIGCTGLVASLLEYPYLKIAGGLALLYVATKLLLPEEAEDGGIKSTDRLWAAVRVVMIADIVMSMDNVIAVAAAAHGSMLLLGFGLTLSIPLIVTGAALITSILSRFPVLIWAGAALLGWIAGEVIVSDPLIKPLLSAPFDAPFFYAAIGSCFVLGAGAIWRSRIEAAQELGV